MEAMEQPLEQDLAEPRIQPLTAEEVHAVSGGASYRKPTITAPQSVVGNPAANNKVMFYR
ncbi:hypothetical protein [Achromobacter aegrifaciens]|uniref:hypothetical protein n=1 Tax=Achromobacter aegrifaciens TaxID=1287736 RepID=UPI00320A0EA2